MSKEQVPEIMFPNLTQETRIQHLVDNCYNQEQHTYQKEFTPDEIEVFRSNLSDTMIALNALSEELKEKKAEYAGKMDPLKKGIHGLLEYIKHKSRQVSEQVYLFDYQSHGLMAAYNSEGELVYTRKLLPAERQQKMRLLNGTND